MKRLSGKKWTARELAAQFGCSVDTIQRHGNKLFGEAKQGATRLFDEAQVTLILESVKKDAGNGRNIGDSEMTSAKFAEVETPLTAILKAQQLASELKTTKDKSRAALVMFADAMAALDNENESLRTENLAIKDWLRVRNEELIDYDLALNDREDMEDTYRRRRR
jgi:hypothetical protein